MIMSGAVAADEPFADLQIRFEGKPISIGPGKMTWSGSTVVRLNRNSDTFKLSGNGKLPFKNEMVAGCKVTCTGDIPFNVTGRQNLGTDTVTVAYQATNLQCTGVTNCGPGSRPFILSKVGAANDSLVFPMFSDKEVPSTISAGGPTPLYQLLKECPIKNTAIVAQVLPGKGNWKVNLLELMSVPGIREEAKNHGKDSQGNDRGVVGLTTPPRFPGEFARTVVTASARFSGVCYWVTNVTQTMADIQIMLPGATWPPHPKPGVPGKYEYSCEVQATLGHEKKHAIDGKVHYDGFTAEWINAAQKLPSPARPAKAASIAEAERAVDARLSELTSPLVQKWKESYAKAVERRDTPAEYAAVRAMCPRGWKE
jgi:hypothetical protein